MASHYIVPATGQQFAPVVRRVVNIAKSVGENVRIDKSMPTARLVVGDRTLARWHELNRARKAVDVEAAADIAQRRAEAAAAAVPPPVQDVTEEPPEEPHPLIEEWNRTARPKDAPAATEAPASAPQAEPEPEPEVKAPAKKSAARKRKSTSTK